MKRDLPNLVALKAFEAAARLGSFKLASHELHVTPTAISHHIRRLEEDMGVQLFIRSTRQVTLTEKGQKLMRSCAAAFDMIEASAAEISHTSDRPVITIATGPSFAARWLTPRLTQFWQDFPNVELRLNGYSSGDNLLQQKSDLTFIWGDIDMHNSAARLILPVRAVPVASPTLVARLGMPRNPSDILQYPLLHYKNRDEWHFWLQYAGIATPTESSGAIMDDANVVFRGAIEGQGAAIGWTPVIDPEIHSRRLVALSTVCPPQSRGYHVVVNKAAKHNPLLDEIVEWFVDQGRHSSQSLLQ
ncbi:LysR substrate-binding domain-containing protein [Ruegeria sp.]|uniref:LysR substrate-binding domain-containing protein n=1 Tax=Ruegeria sp. TaxID=1879320 RepID=UPI003B5B9803